MMECGTRELKAHPEAADARIVQELRRRGKEKKCASACGGSLPVTGNISPRLA